MLRTVALLIFVGPLCQSSDNRNLKALLISDRVNAEGMFEITSIPYSQRRSFFPRDLSTRRIEISSPIIEFLSAYFGKNPGLNAVESLHEVLDWMYDKCDPEVNSDPETSPNRLKCHQLYSELYYGVMDEFARWLITNNAEYNLQIEYLKFKLLNWGTKIEPELFKDDFCNLSEKEDIEELNYHLIQVVCSIITKKDTKFVKKLPLLISEDDETRIRWLRVADEAILETEEFFENHFDIEKIKMMRSNDKSGYEKKCQDQAVKSVKNNY